MRNSTGDGILCDYCGAEIKGDFVYYSFDFKCFSINQWGFVNSGEADVSADLCETCTELFRQRLLDVAADTLEARNRCDISGVCFPKQNSKFYKCYVSRVVVDLSGQPYVCEKCKVSRQLSEGPCECGVKLIREAQVQVDPEYLELNFGADMFGKFVNHVNFIKGLGEAEWTK